MHVEFLDAPKGEWKQEATIRTIKKMEELLAQGHHLNDMAILVRYNKEAAEIVKFVLDYRRTHNTQIEVISADGMLLENSVVVQLLLSIFHYLNDSSDGQFEGRSDLQVSEAREEKGLHFSSGLLQDRW